MILTESYIAVSVEALGMLTIPSDLCVYRILSLAGLQEVRDADGSVRPPRRPRNSALTWEVPPALQDQPSSTQADAPGAAQPASWSADASKAAAGVHSLVALHRSAFQETADAHLRAIVRQLLGSEDPAVSRYAQKSH